MKKTLMAFLMLSLIGFGCKNPFPTDSIEGRWRSTLQGQQESLEFNNGKVRFSNPDREIWYRTVDEVEPNQIYFSIPQDAGGNVEIPFAIYKIENGRLVISPATEFVNTLGGFEVGSRYELPKDFSGHVEIFERIE